MYRIIKRNTKKVDILLKQPQKIFHTRDLANLWKITNQNTLYTTIKRYIKKRTLFRIQKGLYSTVDLKKLNPIEIGIQAVDRFAYLSTESVLAKEGLINQFVPHITLISSVSQRFKLAGHSFIVRKMQDKYLHNSAGITDQMGIKTATKNRAVADMLYYNPKYHFDNRNSINWDKVAHTQKEVGFK